MRAVAVCAVQALPELLRGPLHPNTSTLNASSPRRFPIFIRGTFMDGCVQHKQLCRLFLNWQLHSGCRVHVPLGSRQRACRAPRCWTAAWQCAAPAALPGAPPRLAGVCEPDLALQSLEARSASAPASLHPCTSNRRTVLSSLPPRHQGWCLPLLNLTLGCAPYAARGPVEPVCTAHRKAGIVALGDDGGLG